MLLLFKMRIYGLHLKMHELLKIVGSHGHGQDAIMPAYRKGLIRRFQNAGEKVTAFLNIIVHFLMK